MEVLTGGCGWGAMSGGPGIPSGHQLLLLVLLGLGTLGHLVLLLPVVFELDTLVCLVILPRVLCRLDFHEHLGHLELESPPCQEKENT